MWHGWRTTVLVAIATFVVLDPLSARADVVVNGSFGPNGDIGFVTSPPNLSVTFGGDGQGSIYQMDGFVNVPGKDFGSGPGQSADLANGPPTNADGSPSGLGFSFSATQPTAQQLLLSYSFVNNTGAALNGFQFLYFLDAQVGANFTNQSATVNGSPGLPNPTSYQVGDPSLSTIFTNLMNGTLSNTNDFPPPTVGDVSMALGFSVASLANNQSVTFDVLLSDDSTHLGNFFINQTSPDIPSDILTVSGSVVPEPASILSLTIGTLLSLGYLARRQACTRSQ
jgi:hypothetical protein